MTFNENTNRNKARTWTIVIHVLLLLWFAFTGLKYQDPPPEEGIAINFGYEETGKGDNSQAAAVTPPPPTPVETPLAAPVAQEEVITQDTEDAPVIKKPKEKTVEETPKEPVEETPEEKPIVEPDPDPQPTAEQIEQQAQQDKLDRMFNTNNKGTGTGEGETTGGGDQGDPNGDLNSQRRTGNGGIGGNGKYYMSGKPIDLPEPETGCNYEGVVVVKIAVDPTGRVFEAELAPNNQIPDGLAMSNFGSNTCLINKARLAARASTWSADSNNQRRVGFIVYRFELQ